MALLSSSRSPILIDTSFTVALASTTDQFHERARAISEDLDHLRVPMVITRAVVLEVGNALSHQVLRRIAVDVLTEIDLDPDIEVVPLSEQLYREALTLFISRQDKTWTLVDCISFVVMRERSITDALTADRHFQQAGFRALLLDDDI